MKVGKIKRLKERAEIFSCMAERMAGQECVHIGHNKFLFKGFERKLRIKIFKMLVK